MTNKDGDNKQQDIENRIFDCLKSDDQDKNQPGLLPPQALLSTPPPSLDSTEDTSTLLSPWWSEEPPVESNEESVYTTENVTSNYEFIPTIETAEEEQPITSLTTSDTTTTTTPSIIEKDMIDKEDKDNVLNISVLSFGRSSPKDSPIQWKERCILLATTANEIPKSTENSKDVQKELANIFDSSKECSMICFLKTSQRFIKDEKKNQTLFQRLVPFYGRWISVAKTPTRCKEHLLNPGDMTKKSFTDYYTMEIGEELSHSGEYVSKAVSRTFTPLQHLTQKYIDSWKDGSQQAFFSKFWTSIQKGDAFHLVRDSTKKLLENALGHDKKPSDKK